METQKPADQGLTLTIIHEDDRLVHRICGNCRRKAHLAGTPAIAYCGKQKEWETPSAGDQRCIVCAELSAKGCSRCGKPAFP